MGKLDKLKLRLCSKPKDFSYNELVTLLNALGFQEKTGGKTGGSRRKFIKPETKQIISLHKPHPGNILKEYQINDVINALGLC